jgi:catechol 2,3-dioxygenase-like lactoylglutathione lyase family enzyme
MLSQIAPIPTLPTKDMAAARRFYEEVLGFPQGEEQMDGVLFKAGPGQFFLYESDFAGTNKATAMSFELDQTSFDADIAALRSKGVHFQTFDLPDGIPGEWNDGVVTMGPVKAVWFADPDGNIINVETGLAHSG